MKLKILTEAKYTGNSEGTTEWFLTNFFDRDPELDDAHYLGYGIKGNFKIVINDRYGDFPLLDVMIDPTNGLGFFTVSSGSDISDIEITDFAKQLEIFQVKKVWPK